MADQENKDEMGEPVKIEEQSAEQVEQLQADEIEEQQAAETEMLQAEAELVETQAALQERVQQLEQELEESRAKAAEYLEGWQRARAEFSNYKKRVDRDQAQVYQAAAGSIIKRYLEIADDLERALKNRPQEGEGETWANGVELIYRKLVSFLEAEGVTPMQAEGQMFDPNFHEAIASDESDLHESGQIIEVLQRGYLLGERVLRPAMVRVAR